MNPWGAPYGPTRCRVWRSPAPPHCYAANTNPPDSYQVLTSREDGLDHYVMDEELTAAHRGPRHQLPVTVCGKPLRIETDPTRWFDHQCPDCVVALPEGAWCAGRRPRNRVADPAAPARYYTLGESGFAFMPVSSPEQEREASFRDVVTLIAERDGFIDWLIQRHQYPRAGEGDRCREPHCRRLWPCMWIRYAQQAIRQGSGVTEDGGPWPL